MGIVKKFGKVIKDSVPDEMQGDTVDVETLEPWKDVSKPKEEAGVETKEYEKAKSVAEKLSQPDKRPTKKEASTQQDSYLHTAIEQCEQTVIQSEQQLNHLQSKLFDAKRKIKILKAVKNNNLVFDVSWLIDRIGKLKHSDNGWKHLENEVFGYVEEEMNNGKK